MYSSSFDENVFSDTVTNLNYLPLIEKKKGGEKNTELVYVLAEVL